MLTPSDLTALITRIRLQPDTPLAAAGQLDVVLARVSALTDALRGLQPTQTAHGETAPGQTAALAARLLLADLGLAASYLRADASGVRDALTRLLDALQVELDRAVS